MERPEGYSEKELGPYEPIVCDSLCEEDIGWGFSIRAHLSEERFNGLRAHGELWCCPGKFGVGAWHLITKWLTVEEAIAKYGKVTHIETGPRGGFKYVVYGETRFISPRLDPMRAKAA